MHAPLPGDSRRGLDVQVYPTLRYMMIYSVSLTDSGAEDLLTSVDWGIPNSHNSPNHFPN
jgi:hypothetical protein